MLDRTAVQEALDLRHRLHAAPDLSGHEAATAQVLADWLRQRGIDDLHMGVGGHGLRVRVGHGEGPARLFRADLDGLPLAEATGVPHASTSGTHHACGHDGHMAMLAAASVVWARRPPPAPVIVLFQPAEETGTGMAACLDDPALGTVEVGSAFAVHNVPGAPLGRVLVREGVAAVASTGLRIDLEGATSHASEPEAGRNPAPALGRLAQQIMDAPATLDDPLARAAVVGLQAGGERYGTSAGSGWIAATVRGSSDAAVEALVGHVVAAAQEEAEAGGFSMRERRVEPFPATVNDPDAVRAVRQAADAAGLDRTDPDPFPWSEDFGHATSRWPGALVGLGSGTDHAPLHSAGYDFPDDLLESGIAFWLALEVATR